MEIGMCYKAVFHFLPRELVVKHLLAHHWLVPQELEESQSVPQSLAPNRDLYKFMD